MLFRALASLFALAAAPTVFASPAIHIQARQQPAYPHTPAIWVIGYRHNVTWTPTPGLGTIVLAKGGVADYQHGLAAGVDLSSGRVEITVPSVEPATDYSVFLIDGSNQYQSSDFTIAPSKGAASSLSSIPPTTGTTVVVFPSTTVTTVIASVSSSLSSASASGASSSASSASSAASASSSASSVSGSAASSLSSLSSSAGSAASSALSSASSALSSGASKASSILASATSTKPASSSGSPSATSSGSARGLDGSFAAQLGVAAVLVALTALGGALVI